MKVLVNTGTIEKVDLGTRVNRIENMLLVKGLMKGILINK